jgi:hypothetical protein
MHQRPQQKGICGKRVCRGQTKPIRKESGCDRESKKMGMDRRKGLIAVIM